MIPKGISLRGRRVPVQFIHKGKTIHHAYRDFGPELDLGTGFSAHDGANIRLANAGNPIVHLMRFRFIQDALLTIQFLDDKQLTVLGLAQLFQPSLFGELFDML